MSFRKIINVISKNYIHTNRRAVLQTQIRKLSDCQSFTSDSLRNYITQLTNKVLLNKQIAAVFIQRVQRTCRLAQLYDRIYSRKNLLHMIDNVKRGFSSRINSRPIYVLFSAVLFSWEKDFVTDDEFSQ